MTRSLRFFLPILIALAACRTAAPGGITARAPGPAPAEFPAPSPRDPVVEETRRFEEALETPTVPAEAGAPEPAPPAPAGTLEIAFASGAAELTAAAAARLDALAAELRAAPAAYPLELVASVEDGSGSERERLLLRRRLDAVRTRLQKAGVAGDRIVVVESPAGAAADPGGASPLRPCRVFVIVRQP